MGKKAKVGKSRKDKFYHLAKETGYRSRAAFKLIQLNRKYEFLQRSNIIVDLCAAPGGWCQVAAENAPMSNIIIGIDLVPIPPIRSVRTFQEDITTEKCRQTLKKELKTAKADCFLNDGAPNVGKNWVHDAYAQAELTLHAMRLATEFLRKGGWFVTKLFRSKDYDPLMWVFQQLFKDVHATKPQASRNESAEIFVVCQGYLAPEKIDEKFMDPKHVFQEVDKTERPSIDLIHPEKKKRQREGYPDGDYTLFHSLPATEFFASDDYMNLLAQSSEINIDSKEILKHPLTTAEIKECIKDIKVLGKKDIKSLFLWRNSVKKDLEKTASAKSKSNDSEDEEKDVNDEEEMEEENEEEMKEMETLLEQQNLEQLAAMKKAKKKVRKAQMKQKQRIDLNMVIPGDRPDIGDDTNYFDIKKIKSKGALKEVERGDLSEFDTVGIIEDSDDDMTNKPREKTYFDKADKKYVGVHAGDSSDDEEEMEEEPEFDDDDNNERQEDVDSDDVEEEEVGGSKENGNPLIIDLGQSNRIQKDKQNAWFQKAAFANINDEVDEDLEFDQMMKKAGKKLKEKSDERGKKKVKRKQENEKTESEKMVRNKRIEEEEEKEEIDDGVSSDSGLNEDDDDGDDRGSDGESNDEKAEKSDGDDTESDDSDYVITDMLQTKRKKKKRVAEADKPSRAKVVNGVEIVKASADSASGSSLQGLQLDPEGLAIGAAMVQSRKRRREVVDSGYHRFMFDDGEALPDWFVTDERRHMKRILPVSKDEVEEYKMKLKAVDAQPIKKIAEAKARKKKKMLKRQEKARKKANAVTDTVDVSEKEKWSQIKQIYKKAGLLNKTKASVTYVVAKKGAGKKVRRPAGVKGKFKVVDGRMKKDLRGMQKAEARNSAKGKAGKGTQSTYAFKRKGVSVHKKKKEKGEIPYLVYYFCIAKNLNET